MGGPPCHTETCKRKNLDLLHYVTSRLERNDVSYWLDFGGLLGLIREGDMIRGDDDTDISVSMNDYDGVMETVSEIEEGKVYTAKQSRSYRTCGDRTGKALMLYQIRPVDKSDQSLLDIFFFKRKNNTLRSMWTSDDDTHVDLIFPVQHRYVPAWGFGVNIPHDPVGRLVEKYGPDYMTPSNSKRTVLGKAERSFHVLSRCTMNRWGRRIYVLLVAMVLIFILLNIKNTI